MKRFSIILLLVFSGCATPPADQKMPEYAPRYALLRAGENADGAPLVARDWAAQNFSDFAVAFQKSCAVMHKRAPSAPVGNGRFGEASDWQRACRHFVKAGATPQALWQSFDAWEVRDEKTGEEGLLTGYYEAEVFGSLTPHGAYQTPLYGRPKDLIEVDLGRFRPALEGQRIAGRVEGGRLIPYAARAEIAAEGLKQQAPVLAYLRAPVDAFFLEIQGSGVVHFENGKAKRIGYAAQNGHPYHAIGKSLIAQGALKREMVSMQSIRDWLENNPDDAARIMNQNPSYVFFRWTDAKGAIGAQGVELTAEASLAVDPRFVPLGAPVYVKSQDPLTGADFERWMVAQDMGGAIRGVVRGDVFFGTGAAAAEKAGMMRAPLRYLLFLPKGVSPTPFKAEGN